MKIHHRPFRLLHPHLLATLPLITSASAAQVGYQYFRFTPIKLRTDATTASVQISEFDFLLSGTPISRAGVIVTNPGGNTPTAESPDKLIDGNTGTKWLDFNKSQVVFNFGSTATIDGYRFTTANDANDRDPLRWIFEGSSDGSTWTLLDHQTSDFATPTARLTATSSILLPASPTPYLFTWNGSLNNDWNTTTGNWDSGLWNNGSLLHARFTNSAPVTVNLTEAITARQIEAAGDACTLQGSSISFASIRATGAGATTISNTAPLTIASAITGTGGWTKSGSGNLTLTGANTYVAPTNVIDGSVTYAPGGSYNPASNSNLRIGGNSGRGVLNLDSAGVYKFGGTRVGGDDNAVHTGKGAIYQTAGDATYNTSFLEYGVGVGASGALTDTYGAYSLTGGKLTITGGSRIGCGGTGSFIQSGGEFVAGNHLVIGASTSATNSFGTGVATFTGGTATPTGGAGRVIIGDRDNSSGTLNIGTQAGGDAVVTTSATSGVSSSSVVLLGSANALNATVNLNSGTLRLSGGGLARNGTNAGKTAAVNLNGGTLQYNSSTSRDLIVQNASLPVTVFNGGVKVDTQGFDASISANLQAATGNGIYPAGGSFAVPSNGGAGYFGAPLVTVTTIGSGSGATAIATIAGGVVTGVTLTCPGQGYAVGDTVTFTFAGGGATTAATPFAHVLTAGDVAANGAGGLTKLGTGKLTLSGTNTFAGPVSVTGTLVSNSLSLNNTTLAIHGFTPGAPSAPVEATNTFTTGGIVQVQVDGSFSPGTWPLIYYPQGGSIGGAGIAALQLQTGSLPRGVVATLVDNTASFSVDLNVTGFNPLTWKGNAGSVWDVNTTTNWLIGATPEKYQEGDLVRFNDNATGTTSVTLNTTAAPQSVTFENDTKDYTLSGSGSIAGTGGLTKSNNGTVTILNANSYSGSTTVNGGTLQLGNGTVNGSIAGPLANNATVVFHPAGTSTLAGSISGDSAGIFTKSGSGTQIITSPSNTSAGTFQIAGGTYQIGDGATNSAFGNNCAYDVAAGARLHLNYATAVQAPSSGWASRVTGAGTFELNSAQAINGSANWGPNSATATPLSGSFTGTLKINRGRFDSSPEGLGGTSKLVIKSGAQFLAWTGTYTAPIEIEGDGWGELNHPGALRAAASTAVVYNGNVTLTSDATIYAQDGTNTSLTVGGSITGNHVLTLNPSAASSTTLTVAPVAAVQNSYASTKISGPAGAAGSVVAGNAFAFSSGPLTVDSAILKLNGHDLSFASLSGLGGAIGNYHATTPASLTVGTDNTSTSYAGVLRNGGAASLALVKTGTGTLTLTAAQTYTGNTTVDQGKLAIANAYLADSSTVTIAAGAKLQLDTGAADTVGALVLGGTTVPTGTYSASHPTYGSYFEGTGSLVVGGPYDSWAASKGLTGNDALPDADPDKDGIANLLEFVLGGEPNPTHSAANSSALLPTISVDATHLVFTFRRTDAAVSYNPFVEYGTGLNAWTKAQADVSGVTISEDNDFYGGGTDRVVVRIPRTLAAPGSKLFARLKATL